MIPSDVSAASGVATTSQVAPRSPVRRRRATDALPVPIHASEGGNAIAHVPLAANAPSFANALGKRLGGTRVQRAPSRVVITRKCPSTASLTATPCVSSQNAKQS